MTTLSTFGWRPPIRLPAARNRFTTSRLVRDQPLCDRLPCGQPVGHGDPTLHSSGTEPGRYTPSLALRVLIGRPRSRGLQSARSRRRRELCKEQIQQVVRNLAGLAAGAVGEDYDGGALLGGACSEGHDRLPHYPATRNL